MVKLSQYNNFFKKVLELEQALGIERLFLAVSLAPGLLD